MSAPPPIDPSISDLLRHSPIGSLPGRPVDDVLRDFGLAPLPRHVPAPPAPGLPPLPVIDLHALFKPLTDLADSFGTGRPGAGGAPDPAQMLTAVSSALQTAMSLGASGLEMLMSLWQGAGAQGAASKTAQAQQNSAQLLDQGSQIAAGFTAAAGTVATGSAAMAAVLTKFATSLALAAPTLVTPFGQAFVVGLATESLAEATTVTAATRAQLGAHSAKMAETGTKVPITTPPTGSPSTTAAATPLPRVLQAVQPLISQLSTAAHEPTVESRHMPTPDSAHLVETASVAPVALGSAAGATVAMGSLGARGVGPAPAPAPLRPWAGPTAATEAAVTPDEVAPLSAETATAPGMMPTTGTGMPGAGVAAGAAGDAELTDWSRINLVTAQNGDEVVGEIGGATLPVVGAANRAPEPPPDKELTL